jgi:7-cyano-7-deazaguanine reductase
MRAARKGGSSGDPTHGGEVHVESKYDDALEALRQLDPEDRRRAFSTLKREREDQQMAGRVQEHLLPNSHWSRAHLLRRIQNPTQDAYEQKILIPEITFLGVANQPDFGELLLTFYPKEWSVELKSLKQYKDSFRDVVVSYERLANVVYDDLMAIYSPIRLRLMIRLRPRGGISSCLTIDSDWKIRGGVENFNDWKHNTDKFGFEVTSSTSTL